MSYIYDISSLRINIRIPNRIDFSAWLWRFWISWRLWRILGLQVRKHDGNNSTVLTDWQTGRTTR